MSVVNPTTKRSPYIVPRCPDRKIGAVTVTGRIPNRCKIGVCKNTQPAKLNKFKRTLVKSNQIQVPLHINSMPWFPHDVKAKSDLNNASEEEKEHKALPLIVVETANKERSKSPSVSKSQKETLKNTVSNHETIPLILVETNTSRQPLAFKQKTALSKINPKHEADEQTANQQPVSEDESIGEAANPVDSNNANPEVNSKEPQPEQKEKIEIDLQCPIIKLVSSQLCPISKIGQCSDDCSIRKSIGEEIIASCELTEAHYLRYHFIVGC